MSINIEINKNQLDKAEKLKIHFLPAKVNGEGTADVDNFFNNYTRNENGFLTNELRGYPLKGTEIDVPQDFKAIVLQEPTHHSTEADTRKLRVTGTFDKFIYWNYDKIPSKADPYIQALQWADIAQQLATPITEEEVLAEHDIISKENKQ